MKEFITNTGRVIKVSANQSARTFTIKTESGKYRTVRQSKEDFNSMENHTGNDWQYFLRDGAGNEYYKI